MDGDPHLCGSSWATHRTFCGCIITGIGFIKKLSNSLFNLLHKPGATLHPQTWWQFNPNQVPSDRNKSCFTLRIYSIASSFFGLRDTHERKKNESDHIGSRKHSYLDSLFLRARETLTPGYRRNSRIKVGTSVINTSLLKEPFRTDPYRRTRLSQ